MSPKTALWALKHGCESGLEEAEGVALLANPGCRAERGTGRMPIPGQDVYSKLLDGRY